MRLNSWQLQAVARDLAKIKSVKQLAATLRKEGREVNDWNRSIKFVWYERPAIKKKTRRKK